jgi:hypothetical protein
MPTGVRRNDDTAQVSLIIAQKGSRIPAATAPSGPEQLHTHTAGSPAPKGVDVRRSRVVSRPALSVRWRSRTRVRPTTDRIEPVDIQLEMQRSFLDFCAAALVAVAATASIHQPPDRRPTAVAQVAYQEAAAKRQPNANEYVNYYRSLAGLPAVDRDAGLERAELLHDQYLANWAQACETVSPHQKQLHATPGCPRNPHATALQRSWKAAVE